MQTPDYNEKAVIRFWLWVILASVIIHLMGCTATEITYTEVKTTGGIYEQSDTIINSDTLHFWKR